MAELVSRVSYLKGLAEGLGVDSSTKEGKMLLAICEVLEEFAREVERLDEAQEQLEQYVEDLDQDLESLEDEYYGELEDEDYTEVECPHCEETVYFPTETLRGEEKVELVCPRCGKTIYQDQEETEEGEESQD